MSLEDITEEQTKELDRQLAEDPAIMIGGFQTGLSKDRTCAIFRFVMACPTCAEKGEKHELQSEFMAMDIETGIDFIQAMQVCINAAKQ